MARRDCPSCGTFLVLMGTKDRGPRWRCFGGTTHHFQLGPDRDLVEVIASPRTPGDDAHKARVQQTIDRVTSERADGLLQLAEL
ncbi:MAG TPA: hypothetical protein VL595_20055 [Pseudonocardia sp.]|nr:hypothetical protein [Pseudonocardia sp.]